MFFPLVGFRIAAWHASPGSTRLRKDGLIEGGNAIAVWVKAEN
jgi:hypothetical protein